MSKTKRTKKPATKQALTLNDLTFTFRYRGEMASLTGQQVAGILDVMTYLYSPETLWSFTDSGQCSTDLRSIAALLEQLDGNMADRPGDEDNGLSVIGHHIEELAARIDGGNCNPERAAKEYTVQIGAAPAAGGAR
jgi:hypothetical protein